jgi:ribosome biogenesis GTPase / thiamine phosphate phosphatase
MSLLLQRYGWNSSFDQAFTEFADQGLIAGRVIAQLRNSYTLKTEQGDLSAHLAGKVRYYARGIEDLPAVGDWVVVTATGDGAARIEQILPRQTQFIRKAPGDRTEQQVLAANVDAVFLVSGLDYDFNLRRIERYLVLAGESGARPIIVLNKADLCDDINERIKEVESIATDVPIVAMSALYDQGLEAFEKHLPGKSTAVLLGSSGVGKSTIINHLMGKEIQTTRGVRENDSHGRHTTTHRELMMLGWGAMLIDTPGLRELQLWGEAQSVQDTFQDVAELATACRFTDCSHGSEPGCAVSQALQDGYLDQGRYESYIKLQREIAYLKRKEDPRAQRAEKDRWKKIHKEVKQIYKKGKHKVD